MRLGVANADGALAPRHAFLASFAPKQPTDETICFFLSRWYSPTARRCLRPTERPMKIEIVVDPTKPAPAVSLVSRVAPAPAAAAPAAESVPRFAITFLVLHLSLIVVFRTGGRPRRGRGGGRRKGNERPQKTVADLDAEMEVCGQFAGLVHQGCFSVLTI